jgi:aminomethyltransferase
MGLHRLVDLDKSKFVGQNALREEKRAGHPREIVGFEADWTRVEELFDAVGLAPQVPAAASRVAVPVYGRLGQVGKATSTTWSPTLKKLIGLATVSSEYAPVGTKLEMELTVEAVRHKVPVTVVKTPFFNPKRKTATPV